MTGTDRRPAPPAVLRTIERRLRRTRRFLVFYLAATIIWVFRALTDGWWLAWVFTALFTILAVAILAKLRREQRAAHRWEQSPR